MCAGLLAAGPAGSARAAVAHVVQPGETLWSIAAANNLTTRTVAAFNGVSDDYQVISGATINVPTVAEGAAALASTGATSATSAAPASTGTPAPASPPPDPGAPPLGYVYSPEGSVPLEASAADQWNAMRQAANSQLGLDIYPDGTLSGYRTSGQQAYLYRLFLDGEGAPANPPGLSSHQLGLSVDLADPSMRTVIDQLGPAYGWGKTEAPGEWWHVTYYGG